MSLVSEAGLTMVVRWLHVLAGIVWLGALLHLIVASTSDDDTRGATAGSYLRWAAAATLGFGVLITMVTADYFGTIVIDGDDVTFAERADGVAITTGMLLGLVMFVNVWAVVWRDQRVLLAGRAEGEPAPATAVRRAAMVSRQNAVFAVPLVWFMVAKQSFYSAEVLTVAQQALWWLPTLVVVGLLELNALGLTPWGRRAGAGANLMYDRGLAGVAVAGGMLWAGFVLLGQVALT